MTATMLVLEPIFEADLPDLPPQQYAYRPGRNAQQYRWLCASENRRRKAGRLNAGDEAEVVFTAA